MNWKRTKASYVFLVLFAVVNCIGTYFFSSEFCIGRGIQGSYKWVISLGVLLLGGLFSVLSFGATNKLNFKIKDYKILWYVLEAVVGIAILCFGISMRIARLPLENVGEIFEVVKMKYKTPFPNTYLGVEELYLRILHGFCYMYGNFTYFCIRFHLVLCVIAGIPWYFGIRKLAGRISAISFAAFYYLTPYFIEKSVRLTAEPMTFLFYGIGLFLMACFLEISQKYWVGLGLLGVMIGAEGYLDLFGFTLFAFFISLWHLKGEKRVDLKELMKTLGIVLGGVVVGYFTCIIIKCLASGQLIGKVLLAWFKAYEPSGIGKQGLSGMVKGLFGTFLGSPQSLILAALGMALAVSFFLRKGDEKISTWCGILTVSTICMILGLNGSVYSATTLIDKPFDGSLLALSCAFVLAGIAIEGLIVPVLNSADYEAKVSEKKEADDKNPKATELKSAELKKPEAQKEEIDLQVISLEELEKSVEKEKAEKAETMERPEMLENPLPVPEKKTATPMEYDYDVSEDDDFDIK